MRKDDDRNGKQPVLVKTKQVFTVIALCICTGALFFVVRSMHGFDGRATTVNRAPDIFPDYAGISIPLNIAPLNFRIRETANRYRVVAHGAPNDSLVAYSRNPRIRFPVKRWRALLNRCAGKSLCVDIYIRNGNEWMRFQPLVNSVQRETIDGYLAYRLINPGYHTWDKMGIYQRNVETFCETPILTNRMMNNNCLNCHSFCQNNPEMMLLHARKDPAGTILCREGTIEKISTRVPGFIGGCAYPSWHPDGRFIAFSINTINQVFPSVPDWYIEVVDSTSDLVLYDCGGNTMRAPAASTEALENMPAWSPDGNYLYYCRAEPYPTDYLVDPNTGTLYYRKIDGRIERDSADYYICPHDDRMVQSYRKVRYDLMRVSFDVESKSFGKHEQVLSAMETGKSIAWPRISPDGRYVMFVMSSFGYFTIHHPDADLYCMDLSSHRYWPLDSANSTGVESYHTWSSNGRWFVFSSKRIDGIRARPYICYFDSLGQAHKPFILPQKDPDFYTTFFKTYNVPEMIRGKARFSEHKMRAAFFGPVKDGKKGLRENEDAHTGASMPAHSGK